MKKVRDLPESSFLKLFFCFFAAAFLLAAVIAPDRAQIFAGMEQILSQPCKVPTNYFAVAGYSATFFNMGLVCLMCFGLYLTFRAELNNTATMAIILTTGFGSWGINIQNIWPTIWGTMLFCIVKRKPMREYVSTMLFTTGIAPLITDLLIRHPFDSVVGYSGKGLLLAIAVGVVSGFFVPAGLSHSPSVHKGYNLYNAALPVGMGAFILQALLFNTLGLALPSAPHADTLKIASRLGANCFCGILFGLAILAALAMGCTPKKYWALISSQKRSPSITGGFGNDVFLMNFGVFGLFILGYYNLVGASFNGATFGVMFCMLSTCNSGSHPLNAWPMLLGYMVASPLMHWLSRLVGGHFTYVINTQSILIGACYSNGMTPIVDKYGPGLGFLSGILHFLLVTSVPLLHGGYCLYNGGLTAAFICLILMPTAEELLPTRKQRQLRKAEKAAKK